MRTLEKTSSALSALQRAVTKEPKTRVVVVDEDNRIQGIYMNQNMKEVQAALRHADGLDGKHRVYSAPSGKLFARGHDDVLDPTTVLCEWLRTEDGRIVSIPHD